ncbi:S-layer homology domain-containing protein [Paenibacillus sp. IB182496]|uniref:S-layer homology domain-containing protein n=1 Tax=Paenibacillus sabuli TaxID=2772509 RepID=A0A927GSF1_9BACL|nr:S-layer homology domain-containing protein [Paenibacillus sabuli]MBD2846674.1 S-layer homology domain-containing protein [Paenibacillus sabuli]
MKQYKTTAAALLAAVLIGTAPATTVVASAKGDAASIQVLADAGGDALPLQRLADAKGDAASIQVLADAAGSDVAARKAEIAARFRELDRSAQAGYAAAPSTDAPYAAGKLDAAYLQNGLAALNFARSLAGLPEVGLLDEYVAYAQQGTVLMAASGYGHTPARPEGMSEDFYDAAYKGTSQGNIAYGYPNLYEAILRGWMADEDARNIDRLGHRRWALNPSMGATGLGQTDNLFAMYAFDTSAAEPAYEAIAYPAGAAFPSEIFDGDYPWSITLNPALYAAPDASAVTVTLSGEAERWTFSQADTSFASDYFHIDTDGYGVRNAIVFRPHGVARYEGAYTVTVNGLATADGRPATLRYTTTFFSAEDAPDRPGESDAPKDERPSPWARAEVERAAALELLPSGLDGEYTRAITRAEFSRLAVTLYERVQGAIVPAAPFSDTSDPDVRKMAALGIVNGTGDGRFQPDGRLTREQAAKILDLLLEALDEPASSAALDYADRGQIADWAAAHVASVSAKAIMGGVSANRFDPKGTYTREQSIATMVRIWDRLGL